MRDFAIVGGGVAGLSTARSLAPHADTDGLLLEREPELGVHASTRNSGMIHHYHPNREMRSFLANSVNELRAYRQQKSSSFFRDQHPSLFLLPRKNAREVLDDPEAPGEASLRPPDRVPASIKPQTGLDDGLFLSFAGDGLLDSRTFLRELATDAAENGVRLVTDTPVSSAERVDGGWRISGGGTTFEARVLYNAAGAWIDRVADSCGRSPLGVSVETRHLFFTEINLLPPDICFFWDRINGVYFRHDNGGTLLCACDSRPSEPGVFPEGTDPVQMLRDTLRTAYPRFADIPVDDVRSCQRTASPREDGRPVIQSHRDDDRFVWVGGLKGHGMTAALQVGKTAAACRE